jgi:pimeloyl-ACP methyl ester carboxylesterase
VTTIATRRVTVGGTSTRYLEVEGPDREHPVVLFHGSPSNSEDWLPFLERMAGRRHCIAPDMLGWGESDRPPGFRFTMGNLVSWLEQLLTALAVPRFDPVVHDWGALGLVVAARRPHAVGKAVAINCLAFSDRYRWHWAGRLLRTPILGELAVATQTRFALRQALRTATPRPGSLPEVVDRVHAHWDRGTRRAILELYRDADPDKVAALGHELKRLTCPGLVVWGDADPFIDAEFADVLAEKLGGPTRVEHLPDAGHWPWYDRPDVVDVVADFLTTDRTPAASA